MYKVSLDTIKIKNCQVVTLTGEAIRCYTLPKGDLGATTAKRQLLYVSRHINPVASCSFKSYTYHVECLLVNTVCVYFLAIKSANELFQQYNNDCGYNVKDIHDMLYTTVLDQYRIYGMIEPMLQNPPTLFSQIIYQINPDSQEKLISG